MGNTVELKYLDGTKETIKCVEECEIKGGCVCIFYNPNPDNSEEDYEEDYEEKYIPIFQLKEWTLR